MLLLVILFAIKLLVQVSIFKNIEKKHWPKIIQNLRRLERLRKNGAKSTKTSNLLNFCKVETSNKIMKYQT